MSAGALGYLLLRTTRNRLRRQIARVRSPRYAIALLAGIAYIVLLTRNSGGPDARSGISEHASGQLLVALAVLVLVTWSWAYARDRRILAFSEAEVAFLFPAPVSRRALIHFKLARSQLFILVNTLIWTTVLDAGRSDAPAWMRALSVWCVFSTLQLHRLGAALTRASLGQRARTGRRLVTLAVVVAALGLTGLAIAAAAPVFATARGMDELLRALVEASALPLPALVLAPFRALVRPLAEIDVPAWSRAMVPALGLLAVHYVWVVYSNTAFEEAAAEASLERARELAARRGGARAASGKGDYSPPVAGLRATGRAEVAIFWKNIVMVLRRRRARTLLLAFAAALVAALAAQDVAPQVARTMGVVVLTWGGLLVVLGPQWVRNDLRSDLRHIELLRSYPVPPDALVRAEAAAPAVMVTLAQLVLFTIGLVAIWYGPETRFSPLLRGVTLGALAIVLPFLNYVGLMLMNGAALLFPAWVNTSGTRAGGVDTLGQNMLTASAYALALGVTLVVPALLGSVAILLTRPLLGPAGALVGASVAAAALAFEGWLMSLKLGMIFARIDPGTAGIELG